MLGGPTMNLLIAVVLLTVIVTTFGLAGETPRLSQVSQCVLPATAPADATCTPSDPTAPAAAAGLQPGDVIVSFDGTPGDHLGPGAQRRSAAAAAAPWCSASTGTAGTWTVKVTPVTATRAGPRRRGQPGAARGRHAA